MLLKSRPLAFQWVTAFLASSLSTRPTISSTDRKPRCAMSMRTSSAMKRMKLTTCSGLPVNLARSCGSWVATPVGQDGDAAAQVVQGEGLVGLGQAELPGQAGVRDRGLGRGARATVVAADEDDVGVRLGDAGRDGADADLGHQLHAHAREPVAVLEVVNELGEVLDRV